MSKSFTVKEVAEHKSADQGLYIIIDNGVYEMAGKSALCLYLSEPFRQLRPGFVEEHPGGSKIITRVGGKDASKQFWKYHNEGMIPVFHSRDSFD
jgi:cytochrome b involved in lipid metabolism